MRLISFSWSAPVVTLSCLAVVAATACRSQSSDGDGKGETKAESKSNPSGSVDPCSVVTQTEAGNALGHIVTSPVRGKATVEGGVACVFYGPSAPPGANPDLPTLDSVRVVLVTGAQGKSFFDDYKSKAPAQTIAGLGDQAFFESKSLSVLKGSSYLRVAVIGVPDVLGAERKLAEAALPRM